MFKFAKCVGNVVVHGAGKFAGRVVPFEINSNVLACFKVNFTGVTITDGRNEMVNVGLVGIFNAKVVNHKCE